MPLTQWDKLLAPKKSATRVPWYATNPHTLPRVLARRYTIHPYASCPSSYANHNSVLMRPKTGKRRRSCQMLSYFLGYFTVYIPIDYRLQQATCPA